MEMVAIEDGNNKKIQPDATKAEDEDKIKMKKWWDSIPATASDLLFIQPFGISVVPDELRKWNENAYKPKVVSMGPTYKGTRRDLLQMEEMKWFCMFSLGLSKEDLSEKLGKEVWLHDDEIRRCYTEEISLDRNDLATTMVFDSCFMLALLKTPSEELHGLVSPFDEDITAQVRKSEEVLTDLLLLENQIPLVLVGVLSGGGFDIRDFFRMASSLFGYSSHNVNSTNTSPHVPVHFLELVHSMIFLGSECDDDENVKLEEKNQAHAINLTNEEQVDGLNRCATRLRAAGVTIKPPHDQRVTTNKPRPTISSLNFDIRFDNGTLEIPQLHITESTEILWRNFIAWEHHRKKWKSTSANILTVWMIIASIISECRTTFRFRCKCAAAALLFNGLICSSSDVQLLKDKKVIVDHLNMSNRDLVEFFHSITKGVDRGIVDSSYSKMVAALNAYSATNKATQIPIIGSHYLSKIQEDLFCSLHNFLRRGYNFAATFILVLTVVQTLYSVLSYHLQK